MIGDRLLLTKQSYQNVELINSQLTNEKTVLIGGCSGTLKLDMPYKE